MEAISVLIVDDDEIDRYLLMRRMNKLNKAFRFIEKMNGREAMTYFEHCQSNHADCSDPYPPYIVFLDINMPLMNGWDFLARFKEFKEQVQLKNSVVVMFTSSNSTSDLDRLNQFEFVKGYLLKGEFGDDELAALFDAI